MDNHVHETHGSINFWEVDPYEKVATLTLTFHPTFAFRLKSRSRCPHFFFKFPTISNICKKSFYILHKKFTINK